jgi:hypothetical protein
MNWACHGVGGGGADAPLTLTGRGVDRLARFGFRFIAIEYKNAPAAQKYDKYDERKSSVVIYVVISDGFISWGACRA